MKRINIKEMDFLIGKTLIAKESTSMINMYNLKQLKKKEDFKIRNSDLSIVIEEFNTVRNGPRKQTTLLTKTRQLK